MFSYFWFKISDQVIWINGLKYLQAFVKFPQVSTSPFQIVVLAIPPGRSILNATPSQCHEGITTTLRSTSLLEKGCASHS